MLINNSFLSILLTFGLINFSAFLIMAADKIKSSRPDAPRISEGKLFFLAAAFGALGVYAGMFAFRNKTRKWYFLVGMPLLIAQNAAAAYLIYLFLATR